MYVGVKLRKDFYFRIPGGEGGTGEALLYWTHMKSEFASIFLLLCSFPRAHTAVPLSRFCLISAVYFP